LTRWGLHNTTVVRNASTPELYEIAALDPLSADPETRPGSISSTGAMVAYSGRRTGYL
jgi:phosphoenolpyruvate carboxykinase (ATP)